MSYSHSLFLSDSKNDFSAPTFLVDAYSGVKSLPDEEHGALDHSFAASEFLPHNSLERKSFI